MFTFAPDDAIHDPQPVPPVLMIPALREVLNAVKLRMCFIGHPREPRFPDGGVSWAREGALIESVLTLSAGCRHWPQHMVYAAPTVVGSLRKGDQG